MRRLPSWQRFGVVSQQRLRLRRFDSLVKRSPKLRSEPVSFLFLFCFSIDCSWHFLKRKNGARGLRRVSLTLLATQMLFLLRFASEDWITRTYFHRIWPQIVVSIILLLWAGVFSWLIFYAIDHIVGLRVTLTPDCKSKAYFLI